MARRRKGVVSVVWDRRREEEGLNYAMLRWTNPSTGKREVLETLGFVTPEEAEDRRQDHEAALRLGVSAPSFDGALLVADLLAAYLDHVDGRPVGEGHKRNELNRSTWLTDALGSLEVDRLTTETLATYAGDRKRQGQKRSSIDGELKTLNRAIRWGAEKALTDRRPLPLPPLGEDDARPPRELTEEEVRALITEAHRQEFMPDMGYYLTIAAWSGRRPIAIQALRGEDLRRLGVGPRKAQQVFWSKDKGGRARGWGPVPEPARQALLALKGREGRLFNTRKGTRFTNSMVHKALTAAGDAVGVFDVQPYDLRRFAVTSIIRAVGGRLDVAMRFTGHRSKLTLLRYSFAEKDEAETLAASIGWKDPALRAVE